MIEQNKINLHDEDDFYNQLSDLKSKNEYLLAVLDQSQDNILNLKKEIDRLNLELECKQIELMQERAKNSGKI